LFSYEKPEDIVRLILQYPEFGDIYKEAYEICRNIEGVMEMFSEELYELDRNTVQYMIDEMQDTIDAQKEKLGEQKKKLGEQAAEILHLKELLAVRIKDEIEL
jgi:2C-methyl-D-erythritol 2,4-cyclodiphosphate synthase